MGFLCFVSIPSIPWDQAESAIREYLTLRWASTLSDALQLFSSYLPGPCDNVHLLRSLHFGGTR